MQLLERKRDLEVVSQHVKGCENVGPLHHLAQRTPFQHLGTEDIPRLLCQKTHVDENLNAEGRGEESRQERNGVECTTAQCFFNAMHAVFQFCYSRELGIFFLPPSISTFAIQTISSTAWGITESNCESNFPRYFEISHINVSRY